ncbi:uncharacterized protein LOC116699536 [Etheostoma spectabile]|uniref:uncharacterized protein LOC116699536 n=1 Tax=Etheostoma spectabile TaxID=54343 RepID=UPI0013AEB17B|nr:uncharacterized protein LOC116699536 [Etheostoma spectabile]XP_032388094.1 uncharacterized protein LOC116699536 [Etheostoma spectabile]
MQLLCIAALLLTAVAIKPPSWKPRLNRPKLDAVSKHGDNERSLTPAPEVGDGGSGEVDWPFGHRGPSKGKNPNGRNPGAMAFSLMIKIDNVTFQNTTAVALKEGENIFLMPKGRKHGPPKDVQYVKLIYNTTVPNKASLEFGVLNLAPGFMSDEPRKVFGRQRGPAGGKGRNPGAMAFSPVFKVDNVTFQNTTAVALKEGENIFLMPKHGGRGPHHNKEGRHGPPKVGQYVKLIYNTTEPNKVSIEFGVLQPMNLGEFVGDEDSPEEDY